MTDQPRLDAHLSPPCSHCGAHPSYQEREAQQQPYRGLWRALCARVADWHPDVALYQRDLNRWLAELWAEQPDAAPTFALNTTRIGRPLDEQAPDFRDAA